MKTILTAGFDVKMKNFKKWRALNNVFTGGLAGPVLDLKYKNGSACVKRHKFRQQTAKK